MGAECLLINKLNKFHPFVVFKDMCGGEIGKSSREERKNILFFVFMYAVQCMLHNKSPRKSRFSMDVMNLVLIESRLFQED